MKRNTSRPLAILGCAGCLTAAVQAGTSVWVGGVGNWNTAANWSPAGVPNSTSAVVRVDGEPGASSQVTVDLSPSVGGLTVDAGDAVIVGNARTLTVDSSGGLLNGGTISLNPGGSYTYLTFNNGQTVSGAGEIVLGGNNAFGMLTLAGADRVLTHAAGHTISGAGWLLYNSGDLHNYGSIRATGSAVLTIDPLAYFLNAGTLRAEGSGGLVLAAGAFTNAGHTVEVLSGSAVTIQNGSTVSGGTLAGTGTGRVVPNNGSRLHGVTLATGTVVAHTNAANVTVTGGLTNHGVWNVNARMSSTSVTFSGDQALAGSGELVLSDSQYGRLLMAAASQTLTHDAGHTIRGAGDLLGNTGNLLNRGSILAQGKETLTLDPAAFEINEGAVRAEGVGGLILGAGAHTNAGHVIEAADGSKVILMNGAVVAGGTLASVGAGRIVPNYGSRLDGVTLPAGTVVAQTNGAVITVSGGLANRGRWNLNAGPSVTTIAFSGDQTLTGDGEIVLTDSEYGRITLGAFAQTLTQTAGHTIRGAGDLLMNTGNLINEGAVLAQGTKPLNIDPATVFVNSGTLRAEGPGGLSFGIGTYSNAGQVIEAASGSKVTLLNGAVVTGGTLASAGTGQIVPSYGARLDDVTLAPGTVVRHTNAATVTVTGGLVNRGRWNVGAVSSGTAVTFSGDQTLSGDGEFVFSDSVYNRFLMSATTQTLTHAAGHTIRGAGNLMVNTGNLNNHGRILAVGAQKLIVNPATSFRNYSGGILGGTGTFVFTDGLADNAGMIAPGLSVGTLTVEGDVSNTSSAVFDLELGGAAAGQSDRLVVQGALALDGELRISFVGGYIPEPEDAVVVISAAGLSGFFANAVPAEGNTAFNVLTDAGTCDVTYDYASSPRTVTVSNMRPDPTLLRAVGVEAATEARVIRFAPSAVDWLYTLQHRPSLAGGGWADVPGQGPRPGIGRRDAMVHTNAPAAGFYRVVGEAAP